MYLLYKLTFQFELWLGEVIWAILKTTLVSPF